MDINRPDLVEVGNYTYGDLSMQFSNDSARVKIGNYCQIARDAFFLPSSDHPLNRVSTYPFKTMFGEHNQDAITKGDIIIDDDVWIGYRATILSGVHISQGAVVAAGSVVASDIPPYAIAGGVPAKVIRYRFPQNIIDELLKVDFSRLTREMVMQHTDQLYTELTDVEQLNWLPKKNGK